MKKIIFTFVLLFTLINCAFADNVSDAKEMFTKYVQAANTYSPTLLNFYSPNAKIIRQVVTPDGKLVNATTDMGTYSKQLKISQGTAKIRNYRNKYKNITAIPVPQGVKVNALRQPMNDTYWLQSYQIWQKQSDGNWKIVEELMQTKQQIFLKYADK